MPAAARELGTAQNVDSRAPTTSPPTCVSGRSVLAPSRMNRRSKADRSLKRPVVGRSSHQPVPAIEMVATRVSATNAIPQPTLATALPTSAKPSHMVRPMDAKIPAHQATRPMRSNAPLRTATPSPIVAHPPAEGNCRFVRVISGADEWRRSTADSPRASIRSEGDQVLSLGCPGPRSRESRG